MKPDQNKIKLALQKTRDTKSLYIGPDAAGHVPEMFRSLFPDKQALVVADDNTWKAAGEQVDDVLRREGLCRESAFVFHDPDLYAEWTWLEELERRLRGTDAVVVAVGSGVLNDLTKLASAYLDRPYMIVGTAASMDGYTAYGASITRDGNKQTFDCPAPRGVVFNSAAAVMAPEGMSASGYADMIAKVPAAADWMLADAVGAEKLDTFSFGLVQEGLKEMLSASAEIAARRPEATEKLAEGLIMSGFAMQALQSSRPASGLEHQFSHYWDMEGLCYKGKHVSHGFKVGIGTLVSTACWEFFLQTDVEHLDAEACAKAWPSWKEMQSDIMRIFAAKPAHAARALAESRAKYVSPAEVAEQIRALQRRWPELRDAVRAQIYPFDEVLEKLRTVGAPYTPEMIGVSRERLRETFAGIPYMRSRFTVIDILHRCNLLPAIEASLFGKGGKWALHTI